MKKLAILTINDYNNYGNRLQNYAVQYIFEANSFYVETIRHELDKEILIEEELFFSTSLENNKSTAVKVKKIIKSILMKLKIKSRFQKQLLLLEERRSKFQRFTEKYIVETEYTISDNCIPNDLNESYDYFITGSDQVWNPHFRFCSSIDFLTFALDEKRISFAASMGVSDIPVPLQNKYQEYLQGFKAISIREHRAADIVKDLTGRDTTVLIDPTLNLTKDEWLAISEPHDSKPNAPFVLVYFLGRLDEKYKEFIEQYALSNKLEMVFLGKLEYEKYYTADPSNFIDYINSAETFFTDSYHGIIFSVILNTPFLIFERIDGVPKMNSRMETLKRTLQLPNESFYSSLVKRPFSYDQDKLMKILEIEKSHVNEFIKINLS